jgi:RNA recognition motif-containing protein
VITLAVCGLPISTTEESLSEMFSEFGTVRSLKVIKDLLTNDCKGIAFVGMGDLEAQAAIAGLDGKKFRGRPIRVGLNWPSNSRERTEK